MTVEPELIMINRKMHCAQTHGREELCWGDTLYVHNVARLYSLLSNNNNIVLDAGQIGPTYIFIHSNISGESKLGQKSKIHCWNHSLPTTVQHVDNKYYYGFHEKCAIVQLDWNRVVQTHKHTHTIHSVTILSMNLIHTK